MGALMTDRLTSSYGFNRAMVLGLLSSAACIQPAYAQDVGAAPGPVAQPAPSAATAPTAEEERDVIVVTATKREENPQDVPVSIQAIGTKRLDQLNISNFEDFTKQLPSVSFQTSQPGSTTVYMRGVASGGDGNHSGSLPSVGFYLDEQPITTIGGTLDVHIYDIARIESLAGPQGTLFGASSQAGTIRIITNKPEIGVTSGRVDAEINKVAHGGWGGSLEGMINLPVSDNIAFRASAFYQRDAGYIDNVFGERTYTYTGVNHPDYPSAPRVFNIDNGDILDNNFNKQRVYGGRAALKIDLDENWTVTPSIMHQNTKSHGVFYMDKAEHDLDVVRFRDDEISKDKYTQAALTVEGKVGNFDITYAGAYMHRPTFGITDYTDYTDAYDAYYASGGGTLDYSYFAFFDDDGNVIDPRQYITGGNNFKKMSQELRIASPSENRFRVIGGAFYQVQKNDILQEYHVDNLAADLSVNGYPGLIWLTKQKRKDKDFALFGEASFDVTPQITLTAGGRYYRFNNTLVGFAGFGKNPNFDEDQPDGPFPFPNAVWGSSGVRRCLTVNGLELRDDEDSPFASGGLSGTPCTNVGNVKDGKIVPRRSKDHGFIHRLNAQWKPNEDIMLYATWSRGFRPGGINRQPNAPAYDPDFLTNYEIGWKTSFGPWRWNGAIYHQKWKKFQFSFLGENSLTVIQNGRDARMNGIETDVSYVSGGLSLSAAAAYTDAKTKGNICNFALGNADCDGLDDQGDPDFVVTPSGTRLPVTPKFKATATARYSWPIWSGRAHVQSSIAYQGSAAADLRRNIGDDETVINPNDFLGRVKSSTLVDAFAGYDWQKYNVELFVTNLFDERNELSRFVVCSVCGVFLPQTKIVPGRPRTIGLRLGAKF